MPENANANYSFLDPSDKTGSTWRVRFDGQITTPPFNSKGAADAYLSALVVGIRQPEYPVVDPMAEHDSAVTMGSFNIWRSKRNKPRSTS